MGTDIRERDAQKLRLTPCISSQEMRVSKQAGWRMPPQLLGLLSVRVGALATRELAPLAKKALPAGDGKRNDYPVADLERGDIFADFHHLSHCLMAQNVATVHFGDDAVIDMKIRPADSASGDLDDDVLRMLDFGIRHAFITDIALTMPCECFH